MAKRNANRELDQFLDSHGYHHSRSKQKSSKPATAKPVAPVPPKRTEDPVELVLSTVEQMGSHGRFGFEKVFIAAIWDEVGSRLGMSLPEFKRWLIEQNRRSALTLARADLIGAMNPQMVARSEIQDHGATFHFVLDKRAVRPY
jgi:hypothetical protein